MDWVQGFVVIIGDYPAMFEDILDSLLLIYCVGNVAILEVEFQGHCRFFEWEYYIFILQSVSPIPGLLMQNWLDFLQKGKIFYITAHLGLALTYCMVYVLPGGHPASFFLLKRPFSCKSSDSYGLLVVLFAWSFASENKKDGDPARSQFFFLPRRDWGVEIGKNSCFGHK